MEPSLVIIIVLSSLNLVANILSPLIMSGAFVIKNISESTCWGSSLKIRDNTQEVTVNPQPKIDDKLIEVLAKTPRNSIEEKK